MTDSPRPTAESPALNKAARALLDAFKPREGVPTDLIVHANIEARLLEVQAEAAALSDSAQDAEPSLDAAWKAAEDALPSERWRIGAVKRLNDGYWRAYAEGPIREGWTKSADGPTPTAALQALATALTKP